MVKRPKKTSGEWLPERSSVADAPWDLSLLKFPIFRQSMLPDVDILDEGKALRVRIDLPGMKKEDIKLNVKRDSVVVSAASKRDREEKGRNFYYRERSSQGYFRTIQLPAEVDERSANAKFADGTLELVIDKRHPGEKDGREISIK